MSAAPYQAQRSYCSQPPGGDRFNQERREVAACVCVCVCVLQEEWLRGRGGGDKPLATPQKTKKEVIREVTHICACLCVRECYLATHNQEKKNNYFCQTWETSKVNFQRSRGNTDKSYFSPFILNRFCFADFFVFNNTRFAERDKKKLFFPPTKLSGKENLSVNLEILIFVAL